MVGNLLEINELTKVFTLRQGFSTTRFMAVDRASFALQDSSPGNLYAGRRER